MWFYLVTVENKIILIAPLFIRKNEAVVAGTNEWFDFVDFFYSSDASENEIEKAISFLITQMKNEGIKRLHWNWMPNDSVSHTIVGSDGYRKSREEVVDNTTIALLPVFQILGVDYRKKVITTKFLDKATNMDAFTKIDFIYSDAVASIKVAKAAKSEGELVVTGTKGYIYVPAPWWKTDYFEVRYENPEDNQRFFYQLDGEGIRYEIVAFAKTIETKRNMDYISEDLSGAISLILQDFNNRIDVVEIR